MKKKIIYALLFLLFSSLISNDSISIAHAEIYFIANIGVKNTSLTRKEIREIFLGKQKRWEDNHPIEIVLIKETNVHAEFVKRYIQRTEKQFMNSWKHMLFTGKSKFPKLFSSEIKVIDYISKTDGAIGYVTTRPSEENSLKIIPVTD